MRDFQIKYTEHNAIIFGNGIKKSEISQGVSEKESIRNFIKHKKATGKIVVVNTTQHIPIKEPM